jgi:hypothetical protein
MPTKSRSFGKLPSDLAARERLRAAQAAEAQAASVVYTAMDALDAAIARRDAVTAAATVAVDEADI